MNDLSPKEWIEKLLIAKTWQEIFVPKSEYKALYNKVSLLIHPDRCDLPNAIDAFQQLAKLKKDVEKSYSFQDDAGTVTYTDFGLVIVGDPTLLKKSFDNYRILMSVTGDGAENFRKHFLPRSMKLNGDTLEIFAEPPIKIVSINELSLPLGHARWVLSRMLEFSSYMNTYGYVHAGLNPLSVFIVPQFHGIMVSTFYHMKPIDKKLTTASGKFFSFYPSDIKVTKQASHYLDPTLAKRTFAYLVGDKSGNGSMLRRTLDAKLVDFLQTQHQMVPFELYTQYIALIKQIYGKPVWAELIL